MHLSILTLAIGIVTGMMFNEACTWLAEDLRAQQQRRDDRVVYRIVKELSEKIGLK